MANYNATRESVTKNALALARDSKARTPAHKELIRRFVRSFEKRDGVLDERFGALKYKALLRKAVNRRIDTIQIDLDDVAEFCKKEMESPEVSVDAQVAAEKLILDIEENTLRYQKFFYDALNAEQPERDSDFSPDTAELTKFNINRWRERVAAEKGTADGQAVPVQMNNEWDVRFKPRADGKIRKLREINADCVGSLVQMDAVVVRVNQVKPKVEVVVYTCEVCSAEVFLTVQGDHFTPPVDCPSQRCKDNRQTGRLTCNIRTCKFLRYQEMRVQEMAEHVPVGGVPRSLSVVCYSDLSRVALPGDAVTVTGVYTPRKLPWYRAMTKGVMQDMYLEAHCIVKHKHGYNEENTDDAAVSRQIDEANQRGSLYDTAAKSIAPEIFGLVDVKKALLLVLIGAPTKQMKDGMKIRGDIHTLLMGDPGVAKSQLLKQSINIAPRSVYTTGKGSSGVGLTAAVVRDPSTGEVTLEGGALVLADMGVCCIDEFDKMEEGDRASILEVMEQQSVSIAKAGITTTLNTRTTVLAAANPLYGRYNPYKSPVENINLPAALLSRFDLLFLLLDTVDADRDKALGMHVCKVHSNYNSNTAKVQKDGQEAGASEEGDVLNLGFKPFDSTFMRSFIRRARTFDPLVDEATQKDIIDAYVTMRDEEKGGDMDSRKSYTTPRTLLAILRLSQAHARARFSGRVERQDFEEAMRLMKASKESVELSSPAKRDANPLDIVYDVIADLARRSNSEDGWVELAHVESMAGHKALSRDVIREAIENWESLNVLCFNPEKTMVRFLVPPA